MSSILELEAAIAPDSVGGLAFDYYGPSDFKFITLDAANDQIIVGHVSLKSGVVIDATYAKTLDDTGDNTLKLSFSGAAVNIAVNNAFVGTYGFNAALVDGDFGLVSMDGTTNFHAVTIRTNDPVFAAENLLAASAPATPVAASDLLTADALAFIAEATKAQWIASGTLDADAVAALDGVSFAIADLSGLTLGQTVGDTITIDVDAAGYGWFVDGTPNSG